MQIRTAIIFFCAAISIADIASAEQPQSQMNNVKTVNRAFKSGERLTYNLSWSDILKAGTAVMEVKEEKTHSGRRAYRIVSTARSTGIVSKFYNVTDMVQSVLDAEELYSLSFSLNQTHGKRKKQREMVFDHVNNTVKVLTDGKEETYNVPERIHDSLSSLYYVRTKKDFTDGKTVIVDVFDNDKSWSVEVQVLGRERIKTVLGEFDAVKVKTYPRYEGVFQHKGEIFIWFTDDMRRIPVLMKSKIAIGSIFATLIEMKTGDEQ